jgi:bifunctional non-homologous end joining protein LigD
VNITHPEKIYWPDDGIAKGDLIEYYRDISSVILPYLKDRPQSLHRFPNGIAAKGFFQKDVSRQPPPEWIETIRHKSESDGKTLEYLVCTNASSLLYMANLGCIEMNPWNSRIESLDRPDYLIIDLDPEAMPFAKVVETALAVRKFFDGIDVECYCKTSGKRGLHLFVPVAAEYDYEQVRQFAQIVAQTMNARLPKITSVVRGPAQRQHRVYLDYLQNKRGATLAAPYSVRPVPGATVSTPLKWAELKRGLDPTKFTLRTVRKRVDKVGDLWKPVLGPGVDLAKTLDRLSAQR